MLKRALLFLSPSLPHLHADHWVGTSCLFLAQVTQAACFFVLFFRFRLLQQDFPVNNGYLRRISNQPAGEDSAFKGKCVCVYFWKKKKAFVQSPSSTQSRTHWCVGFGMRVTVLQLDNGTQRAEEDCIRSDNWSSLTEIKDVQLYRMAWQENHIPAIRVIVFRICDWNWRERAPLTRDHPSIRRDTGHVFWKRVWARPHLQLSQGLPHLGWTHNWRIPSGCDSSACTYL